MTAYEAYSAFFDADVKWQARLTQKYGKWNAGDARYDERGYATPELKVLYDIRQEARQLWEAAKAAERTGKC